MEINNSINLSAYADKMKNLQNLTDSELTALISEIAALLNADSSNTTLQGFMRLLEAESTRRVPKSEGAEEVYAPQTFRKRNFFLKK